MGTNLLNSLAYTVVKNGTLVSLRKHTQAIANSNGFLQVLKYDGRLIKASISIPSSWCSRASRLFSARGGLLARGTSVSVVGLVVVLVVVVRVLFVIVAVSYNIISYDTARHCARSIPHDRTSRS